MLSLRFLHKRYSTIFKVTHSMSQEQTIQYDQPLERYLQAKATQPADLLQKDFPSGNSSYFQIYAATKKIFSEKYYNNIDITANIGTPQGTVYTKHGIPHVAELIRHAGNILGLGINDYNVSINGYESFLLLMAILVHDVGMFMDRDGHEGQCENIILTHREALGLPVLEAKIIGEIAAAHTGRHPKTKKYLDTFSTLEQSPNHFGVIYRKRVLASIVRLADELSENSERAHEFVAQNPKVNDDSKLRHAYCKSIANISPNPLTHIISVEYDLSVEAALTEYSIDGKSITLIEHIVNCLKKMEQERAYCTRYFAEVAYLSTIEATFNIYALGEYGIRNSIVTAPIKIGDTGYPRPRHNIAALFKKITPNAIRQQYQQKTGKELE